MTERYKTFNNYYCGFFKELSDVVAFKKLNQDAIIPKRQNKGDVGYDLHSIKDVLIKPHQSEIIPTGLAWEAYNKEMQIRPRSGLAAKHMITVLNTPGTIDSNYRKEIGVILINHSNKEYHIKKGDRIAQAVFNVVYHPTIIEVEELSKTDRGDGFGSSGK